MAKTPCSNVTPSTEDKGARDGMCSDCGAFLAISSTGFFRRHGRRLAAGNPKIAQSVAEFRESRKS